MAVRFRIRTSAGQELSFATSEVFEDFVRSGDLSPDDLVYDSEDGSWSPARTHPIVLDIEYEREAAAEAEAASEAEADEAPADDEEPNLGLSLAPERGVVESEDDEGDQAPTDDMAADPGDGGDGPDMASQSGPEPLEGASLGLDLTPEADVSEEEATRAFVERMEAEREASIGFGSGAGLGGVSMDDSSTLAEMLAPSPEERERAERAARPRPKPKVEPSRPAPPRAVPARGGGFGRLVMMAFVAAVVAGGAFVGYQSFAAEAPPPVDPTQPVDPLPVEREPEPTPQPVIAQTTAAIRERAQERFLTATQNALRDLPPVPDAWATGTYFSVPSEHPEVRTAWERYLTTIRTVRTGDVTRYTEAFESALDDAAIPDDERPDRRARAMAAFDGSAEARAAHYDRVEALASAAIQSHDALVESEGLVLYDQGGSAGGRTGMGAGAYGRDEEAELLLSQVVDLLIETLDAEGRGPGTGSNVRAWVWDGFLDAATR